MILVMRNRWNRWKWKRRRGGRGDEKLEEMLMKMKMKMMKMKKKKMMMKMMMMMMTMTLTTIRLRQQWRTTLMTIRLQQQWQLMTMTTKVQGYVRGKKQKHGTVYFQSMQKLFLLFLKALKLQKNTTAEIIDKGRSLRVTQQMFCWPYCL